MKLNVACMDIVQVLMRLIARLGYNFRLLVILNSFTTTIRN